MIASRREFLKGMAGTSATLLTAIDGWASGVPRRRHHRRIDFIIAIMM